MAGTLQLHESVESVVVLKPVPGGGYESIEVYAPDGVSKTTTKKMRPVEKVVRRMVRAHQKMLESYSERHESSSAKKKNGWLKDIKKNMAKSMKDGRKELKVKSLF